MKKQIKHSWTARVLSLAAMLIWMAVISGFSAQNGEESSGVSRAVSECVVDVYQKAFHPDMTEEEATLLVDRLELPIRKLAHMTEYAILSLLAWLVLTCFGLKRCRNAAATAFCFVYASLDELHQLFVPGRSGQLRDVCIDTAGALFAMLIVFCIKTCYDDKRCKRIAGAHSAE